MEEAPMSRRIFALIGLFVVLTTAAALAQEQPTYEGRGYGGPLGVGPNFQQGGQWGPPVYGQGQSKSVERYREPQHIDRVQRKRNSDDDNVKTAKKMPAPEESKEASKEAKSQSENSSIITIGSDHDKTTPVTEQKKTDVAKSDKSKSSNENSTIASVASSTTANADPVKGQLSKRVDTDASGKTVATCKRYFPTVGQTITVPCD
jgi:hypothetical protein